MIDHDAHQTVTANDQGSSPDIIDHGSPEPASATVGADDHDDHDDRRGIVARSSDDAHQERGGSGALLGLEPANTENTGLISAKKEDSNHQAPRNPLLGTIYLFASIRQSLQKPRKSASFAST